MNIVAKTKLDLITVRSTLPAVPFPPPGRWPIFRTARLLIRPYAADDLEALHALRAQNEVMQWTSAGTPDATLDRTREMLAKKLDDDINYGCVICLASTGEVIGSGGVGPRTGELGWPNMGYILRKEFWGRGYATEFTRCLLDVWWALPRAEVVVAVDRSTVAGSVAHGDVVAESLVAITIGENEASRHVLEKVGMTLVKIWEETDRRDATRLVDLYGYTGQTPERNGVQVDLVKR
ncbi:hypothetical protein RJ55_04238 [Drechmeria coniospora]|nr:hypothetical protein RJ55_04238 [Drechmeria coniospora]